MERHPACARPTFTQHSGPPLTPPCSQQRYGRKAMRNAYDAITTVAEQAPALLQQPAVAQVGGRRTPGLGEGQGPGPVHADAESRAAWQANSSSHVAHASPPPPLSPDHPAPPVPQAGHAARRRQGAAAPHRVPHRRCAAAPCRCLLPCGAGGAGAAGRAAGCGAAVVVLQHSRATGCCIQRPRPPTHPPTRSPVSTLPPAVVSKAGQAAEAYAAPCFFRCIGLIERAEQAAQSGEWGQVNRGTISPPQRAHVRGHAGLLHRTHLLLTRCHPVACSPKHCPLAKSLPPLLISFNACSTACSPPCRCL